MTNTLLTKESPEVAQFYENLKYLKKLLNADNSRFRPF